MSEKDKKYEFMSELESVLFENERKTAMIGLIWSLINEGRIEVRGIPENYLDYALYDIECGLQQNNENLSKLVNACKFL